MLVYVSKQVSFRVQITLEQQRLNSDNATRSFVTEIIREITGYLEIVVIYVPRVKKS